MTLGKIFRILIFSSLAAAGAANSQPAAGVKGDKVPPKGAAAPVVLHHAGKEAPIVIGRSAALHPKTKLHHVKIKPLDSNENSTSADGSP